MDQGLYDVDVHNVHQKYDRGGAKNEQEMWRKYNRLIKDVDAESAFWEENRNLNRAPGSRPGKQKQKSVASDDVYDDAGEDGEGKKYRGPDKGKGGRRIGPDGKYLPIKRGGKKGKPGGDGGNGGGDNNAGNNNAGRGAGRGGRGGQGGRGRGGGRGGRGSGAKGDSKNTAAEADLSKVQKRRKNDNKAKIGNHHRKDRATKKASGGMVI